MDTNTIAAVTRLGEKLDSYISVLAQKAGVAVEHFWPMFIKQQTIEGYGELILIVLGAIALVLTLKLSLQYLSPKKDDVNDNDISMYYRRRSDEVSPNQFIVLFFSTITILILTISTMIRISQLPSTISKINNPEYHAIQSVLELSK